MLTLERFGGCKHGAWRVPFVVQVGVLLAAAGCRDYTCVDTATCVHGGDAGQIGSVAPPTSSPSLSSSTEVTLPAETASSDESATTPTTTDTHAVTASSGFTVDTSDTGDLGPIESTDTGIERVPTDAGFLEDAGSLGDAGFDAGPTPEPCAPAENGLVT